MLSGLFEALLDLFVGSVSDKIDKEIVFPLPFLAGSGFYIGQVDIVSLENLEDISQSAGLMRGTKQYGGLVLAGRLCIFGAYHQEPGYIVSNILDVFAHNLQSIQLGGDF